MNLQINLKPSGKGFLNQQSVPIMGVSKMKKFLDKNILLGAFLTTCILMLPVSTIAAEDMSVLKIRINALEAQLAEVRTLLDQQVQESATKAEVQSVKQEVQEEIRVVQSTQYEWKSYDSKTHMAGYANVGYSDGGDENDGFGQMKFNPIFHYGYKDFLLLESEFEFEIGEDGETEVALEYLTIDWFINDYIALVAGKFLSPIGQFQQNLHPGWINKLPTAPIGFMHDQAQPSAEVGVQLRGGFNVPIFDDASLMNYAVYVGNGPILELNEDGDEIEAVEAAGFTSDEDDNKVFGGRLGFVPFANMEVGVSGGLGNLALEDESDRDYDVLGFDLFYRWKNLDLRGEYIKQKVGALASSVAPEGQKWEAWYAQASYKLMPSKFELVARYADFNSNHGDQAQEQWALGLNYLFAAQGMAKFSYEFNDGLAGEATNDNKFLIQLSYGF
jgi:porin-like protein